MNGDGGMEAPDLRRAPAERLAAAVLPASAAVWAAEEIMRFAGVHATLPLGVATGLAAAVAWGAAGRRNDIPESLPWWIAIAGSWMTAASDFGPLHWWPYPWLTVAGAIFAVAASKAAHRHQAVIDAREWREAKADWLGRSHDWGLGGSHLLDFKQTRLGELYTISTKGTGHRASHFVGHALEEFIAEAEDLAINRVRVMGHGLAGRIRISVRRINPWADALLHPLVCDEPEVELPEERSIRQSVLVGQDPETGAVLSLPLWDKVGAKNVSITGMAGAGKGVLLDDISEWVTACPDAMQVRLNLSDKGWAEIESWGPACHLTAFGPDQAARAAAVLKVIADIIGWRARNYKRGQYKPTRRDPLIVVIRDESDAAAAALKAGFDTIATKGREYGVAYVHAGQRGTHDYGSAKQRTQDTIRCVGTLNRAGETRHAAGSMAGAVPDMASYGENQPGVWSITINGASVYNGRTWVFSDEPDEHGAEVEAIAAERAFEQPELPAACREFLGETYEELLKTEVFANWARANGYADDGPDPEEDSDATAAGEPAPALPPLPVPRNGAEAPAPAADRTVLTDDDPFRGWEMDMNDRERQMLDGLAAKLGGARRMFTETLNRPAPPQVPAEVLAAHVAERWWKVGEAAGLPEAARPRLVEMLGEGTTISKVAKEFGVTKWTARQWLQRFRNENGAYVDGTKATAKWRLPPPPAGDDTQ